MTCERQKSNRAEMECQRNESAVEGRKKGDNSLERVLEVPRDCCDDRKQSIEGAGARDAASAPGTAGLRPWSVSGMGRTATACGKPLAWFFAEAKRNCKKHDKGAGEGGTAASLITSSGGHEMRCRMRSVAEYVASIEVDWAAATEERGKR